MKMKGFVTFVVCACYGSGSKWLLFGCLIRLKTNSCLFTVFGNTGLHLILRGSVVLQTSSAFSPTSERYSAEFPYPTTVFEEDELQVTAKV